MRKKIIQLLTTADLKPEEIKIYLLLLKLQNTTITELTVKSGLNFMMVYRTVKRLYERGLVEPEKLNNKQNIYKPLSLQSLIKKINLQQRKLNRLEQSLKGLDSILPFMDMEDSGEDDTIEIKDGLDAFREEYLKLPGVCLDEYLCLGSMESYWRVAEMTAECPEERGFVNQRMANGIFARVINTRCKEIEEVQKRDSLEKRTLKIKEKLPIMTNYFAITPEQSTLFICDKENPRAIIMKQKDLLNLQKEQFKVLWEK